MSAELEDHKKTRADLEAQVEKIQTQKVNSDNVSRELSSFLVFSILGKR